MTIFLEGAVQVNSNQIRALMYDICFRRSCINKFKSNTNFYIATFVLQGAVQVNSNQIRTFIYDIYFRRVCIRKFKSNIAFIYDICFRSGCIGKFKSNRNFIYDICFARGCIDIKIRKIVFFFFLYAHAISLTSYIQKNVVLRLRS